MVRVHGRTSRTAKGLLGVQCTRRRPVTRSSLSEGHVHLKERLTDRTPSLAHASPLGRAAGNTTRAARGSQTSVPCRSVGRVGRCISWGNSFSSSPGSRDQGDLADQLSRPPTGHRVPPCPVGKAGLWVALCSLERSSPSLVSDTCS